MGYEATATLTSMCNSLIQKYWSMIEPVHQIRNQFVTALNELETTLANMVFSATSEIEQALHDLENDTKGLIPGDTIDAVREVKSFIDACECLYGTGNSEQGAVAGVLGGLLGIYDQIDDYVGTIVYPEFQAGTIANTINKLLDGANIGIPGGGSISEILARGDCMLYCLGTLCPGSGSEAQLIADDLQELYDDFQLDDDPTSPDYGKVKYDEMYQRAGLTEPQSLNMNNVINGIGGVQSDASTGVGNSVGAIKDAIKGGLF